MASFVRSAATSAVRAVAGRSKTALPKTVPLRRVAAPFVSRWCAATPIESEYMILLLLFRFVWGFWGFGCWFSGALILLLWVWSRWCLSTAPSLRHGWNHSSLLTPPVGVGSLKVRPLAMFPLNYAMLCFSRKMDMWLFGLISMFQISCVIV